MIWWHHRHHRGVALSLLFVVAWSLVMGLKQGLTATLILHESRAGDTCCPSTPFHAAGVHGVACMLCWVQAGVLQLEHCSCSVHIALHVVQYPTCKELGKVLYEPPATWCINSTDGFKRVFDTQMDCGCCGKPRRFWERIGGNFQTGWLSPCPNRAPGTAQVSQ